MSELVKLNFGCGSIHAKGWENLDREDHGQEYLGITTGFENNHFDCIVAHCSIQMNEWHSIPALLKDLNRILKPSGVLRISLPNILAGFRAYNANNIKWFPNGEDNIDIKFSAWLTWYSTTKTLLTQKALQRLLYEAGFRKLWGATFGETVLCSHPEITELDTRQHEALFYEAKKEDL